MLMASLFLVHLKLAGLFIPNDFKGTVDVVDHPPDVVVQCQPHFSILNTLTWLFAALCFMWLMLSGYS
jgi:hypothetical protein